MNSSCGKFYCIKCLWNRYGCKLADCFSNKNWTCPFCKNMCNCAPCLENRGINPSQFSCESLLSSVLDLPYPFSSYESPNVPAICDFKPVYFSHALKKRKMYVPVNESTTSPTSPHSPSKPLKKVTSYESVGNEHSNSSPTPELPSSSSPRFSKNFSPPEDYQNVSSNHSSPNDNSLDSNIKQEDKESKDRYDKDSMDYEYDVKFKK